MPLSDHDIELIDSYLKNSLDDQEGVEFRARLNNTEFKEAVKDRKLVIAALKAEVRADLKKDLVGMIGQMPSSRSNKKWYMMAASLVAILVIGYAGYINTGNIDYNEIYDQYYEPYPISIQRGDDQQMPRALKMYSDGNNIEAIEHLSQMVNENIPVYYLYLGSSYLEINKPDEAINNFQMAAISNDIILRQHADWYLVMAYLKSKNNAQLKKELEKISHADHLYKSRASVLLKKIEE
jgi:tetratricopeptide (TPR) repeat protein